MLIREERARSGTGSLRLPEPAERPQGEGRGKNDREPEREGDRLRLSGDEPSAGLEQGRDRVDARDGVDPAVEESEGHVHGREKEREEDRNLHDWAGLERA